TESFDCVPVSAAADSLGGGSVSRIFRPKSETPAQRRERFQVLGLRVDAVLLVFEGFADEEQIPEAVKAALAALKNLDRSNVRLPAWRDAVFLPAVQELWAVTSGAATYSGISRSAWMTESRRWHLQEVDVVLSALQGATRPMSE
ncbi:MAG: hypothetical protein ACRDV9_01935, partial [Acidimicrobiia bacterium]